MSHSIHMLSIQINTSYYEGLVVAVRSLDSIDGPIKKVQNSELAAHVLLSRIHANKERRHAQDSLIWLGLTIAAERYQH